MLDGVKMSRQGRRRQVLRLSPGCRRFLVSFQGSCRLGLCLQEAQPDVDVKISNSFFSLPTSLDFFSAFTSSVSDGVV